MTKSNLDLLQGTLDMLILKTVALEPMHGYGFHLESEIEKNVAAGMDPEEARYAALRSFGGVEQIKEESRDVRRSRDRDSWTGWSLRLSDIA